jgi:integrase
LIDTAEEAWKERDDYIGFRDYVMILISADTGARRQQIRMLDIEHFNPAKNTLFVPLAKGGRDTIRLLSNIVTGPLTQYIEVRKRIESDCEAMFLDHSGKRLGPTAMSERFRGLREKAGIDKKGAGFHAPRRGKTLRLKKGKLTEEEINDAMGWKEGSRMSHIYGALDQEEVQKKAYDADRMFKEEENDV